MSLFGSLFPEISNRYQEKQAREAKEIEERARLKQENLDCAWKLINPAIAKHHETALFSAVVLYDSGDHRDTPFVLTENRLLFTILDYVNSKRTAVLVEIPYEEIYELTARSPLHLHINWQQIGKVPQGHDFWAGTRYGCVNMREKLSYYAQDKLGKNFKIISHGSSGYINRCWKCHAGISSTSNKRCPICKMFICSSCGSCFCNRE